MDTSLGLWLGFGAGALALIAFDLGVVHRRDKAMSVRGAVMLSGFYVTLSLLFGAGVYWLKGADSGTEFFTGYLIEKALSVDNIFVFVLLFSFFQVPAHLQYKVLFWGVFGALVMRLVLILAGTALLAQFHWLIFVFGGFLILTGAKMLVSVDAEPNVGDSLTLRWTKRLIKVSDKPMDGTFLTRENGRLMATQLLLVLILVEATDLIFALDSIPAIFAITEDPFIVYTSNVFAILGLRALYFAIAGIVQKFHYLKYALSLVLVFIGIKMVLNGMFGAKTIPTEWALLVTALLIAGSVVLSLVWPKPEEPLNAPLEGEEPQPGTGPGVVASSLGSV